MSRPPLVSILTPAYKPAHFAAALRSALRQTFVDFEHVICDDSPGEGIARIVADVAGDDRRVRYVRNDGTIGGRANYLKCFGLARGTYVKFLNDDDLLAPSCLARMTACLDADPDVTLVTSYRGLIDGEDRSLPDTLFNRQPVRYDSRLAGHGLLDIMLRRRTNIIGEPTTVMFRRADGAANRPHIFSFAGKAAPKNGDTFLWAHLLSRGDAVYLTEPLSFFRQHGGQTQRQPDFLAKARAAWEVLVRDCSAAGIYDVVTPRGLGVRPLDAETAAAHDVVTAALRHARDFFAAGAVFAAESAFREILVAHPESADARSDLACVLWTQDRRGEAIQQWHHALGDDPEHTDAAVNLIEALVDQGEVAAACELGRSVLQRVPWAVEVRRATSGAELARRRGRPVAEITQI